MPKHIRAALLTYRDRQWFWWFAVLLVAVQTWVIVSKQAAAPRGSTSLFLLELQGATFALFCALLGDQVKTQFLSHRSNVIPGYRTAHLNTALLLGVIVGIVVMAPTELRPGMNFQQFAEAAVFLWFVGLAAFGIAYFLHLLFIFIILQVAFMSKTMSGFLALLTAGDRGLLANVILINVLGSAALLWRMWHVDEEMFEFRWVGFGQSWPQANKREVETPGSFFERLYKPDETRYERIERPLGSSLSAQLNHFQLGMAGVQSTAMTTVTWIATLWIIGYFIPAPPPNLVGIIVIMPVITLLSGFGGFQRDPLPKLEWIMMLPFARKDLVARIGGAMAVLILKLWCCYAIASYFVAWMPQPGIIAAPPPLLPFATSLADQFLIFGIISLPILWRRLAVRWLGFPLAVGAAVVAIDLPRTAVTIAAMVLAGTILSWISYRQWCRVDIA